MISTQKKTGIGNSHAKIILIGEHAVVYQQPAIALPLKTLQTKAKITLRPDGQQLLVSQYYTGPLDSVPHFMRGISHLVSHILKNKDPFGFTLEVVSDLPIERGMGSSASVAIAIIRALYDLLGLPLDQMTLLSLANIAEKDTHKNPSGLDAATAASETPIWMIRDETIDSIPINLSAYLVICDSGIKGQTAEAITEVKRRLELSPLKTNSLLSSLGELSYQARKQLASNDIYGLGLTLDVAQERLVQLGVSEPKVDALISLAKKNGALGAKLTGGGRGGCFICLVKTNADAKKLASLMRKNGAISAWIEPLSENNA